MILLPRYYTPLDMGTFGVMHARGWDFYTVELPWRNNAAGVSCIPEGTYLLKRCTFYGGDGPGGREDYETFELLSPVGRSEIKIHIANAADELAGCLAIGNALGIMRGRWAVLRSREAHGQWMRLMHGIDEEQIRIYQAVGQTGG